MEPKFFQPAGRKRPDSETVRVDPVMLAETERYRRRLRLTQNTIRNRSDFLRIEAGILEKLEKEGGRGKQISALRNRMAEQQSQLEELKQREADLETILGKYPEFYRGPEADLLERPRGNA